MEHVLSRTGMGSNFDQFQRKLHKKIVPAAGTYHGKSANSLLI